MPWVRAVAIRSARPALASQAEKAKRTIGAIEKFMALSWRVQTERAIKRDRSMPSKHRRAERRWARLNARPANPKRKADEKAKWIGVIRQLWNLTTSF